MIKHVLKKITNVAKNFKSTLEHHVKGTTMFTVHVTWLCTYGTTRYPFIAMVTNTYLRSQERDYRVQVQLRDVAILKGACTNFWTTVF